jgi:uncharacterized membrane protein YheB (UPF0754 family)
MLHELGAHPFVYALIPLCGALIGFAATKIAMLGVLRPPTFLGVGRVGTRATVAAHRDEVAAEVAALVSERLVSGQELLSRLDPETMVASIEVPLRKLVDESTVELLQHYKPDLWEMLPLRIKQSLIKQARSRAPELARNVLAEIEIDADAVLDVEELVWRTFAENPALLLKTLGDTLAPVFSAIVRRGCFFGFVGGLIELPIVVATHQVVTLPIAGLVIGVLATLLAITPAKRPHAPRSVLGIPLRNDLDRFRHRIGSTFASALASKVLVFGTIVDALAHGSHRERVFTLVRREVISAVDAQTSYAKPFVSAAFGGKQLQMLKNGAATTAVERAGRLTRHLAGYADEAMDVRNSVLFRFVKLPATQCAPLVDAVFSRGRGKTYGLAVVIGIVIGVAELLLMAKTWG